MDFDDLRQRYKILPVWIRVLCACTPALLFAGYLYLDKVDALSAQLDETRASESAERKRFEDARTKKGEIPKLEEQLQFIEGELSRAKDYLPDAFQVDDILNKTADLAREHGVTIRQFKPLGSKSAGDAYKYQEQDIQLITFGEFPRTARFFDALLHLDKIIHVRRFHVVARANSDDEVAANAVKAEEQDDPRSSFVVATADLVIFRSMTELEIAAAETAEKAAKKDAKNARQEAQE